MHTLRFAVLLLLLVIASQASVIKSPEQQQLESEQPSNVANEVPVESVISEAKESLVAEFPQVIKTKVPQVLANIETASKQDKVSNVEVASVSEVIAVEEAAPVEQVQKKQPKLPNVLPKLEAAPVDKEQLNKEKLPNVVDKVEAAPVDEVQPKLQKKQPKLPNVKPKLEAAPVEKEQLNKEKFKVEAASVENEQLNKEKIPNVIDQVEAAPVDKVQPKLQKKQPKLPNVLPKLEAAPAQKEQLSKEKFKVEAAPIEKVQPKLPNVSAKIEAAPEQENPSNAIQSKIPKESLKQESKENEDLNEYTKQVAVKLEGSNNQKQVAVKLEGSNNQEQVAVKLEGSDNQVVNQAKPEARTKLGNTDYFYIVDEEGVSGNDSSNATTEKPTKHTHTHEHIYYKPALFPFPPLPYDGSSGSQGHGNKYTLGQTGAGGNKSNNQSNKYGSSGSTSNVDKGQVYGSSAFYPLPLLPIPFWKPGQNYNSNQKYNKTTSTDEDEQLYSYKPNYYEGYPPFYAKERRAPSKDNQQGLVLIGHIFLHIRPQAGKEELPTGNSKPKPSEDKPSSDIKIEEPFQNSQLLLQPVVYPATNKKNKDNSHPLPHQIHQINEIYRSLHLVHPSTQERSAQSPEINEDGAVLFAVEIPKPIYRFFKSVFGVFSY
ncbi:hypothetical protein ACLKA7_017350 [Drosophila subpalustris]